MPGKLTWEEWETVHKSDEVGMPVDRAKLTDVRGKQYLMLKPLKIDALRDMLQAAYEHISIDDHPFPPKQPLAE